MKFIPPCERGESCLWDGLGCELECVPEDEEPESEPGPPPKEKP